MNVCVGVSVTISNDVFTTDGVVCQVVLPVTPFQTKPTSDVMINVVHQVKMTVKFTPSAARSALSNFA